MDALPSHVVVFDTLAPKIGDFLSIYKPLEVFFHSDHVLSNRLGKNIIIYERVDAIVKPPASKSTTNKPHSTREDNDEL